MKKAILFIFTILSLSCIEEQRDYATVSGKILNPDNSKTLTIFKGKDYSKTITLSDDGSFKDTLKVEADTYTIKHGNEYGTVYLENGYITSFKTNYNDFDNQLVFSGDGADVNNFSIQSYLISGDTFTDEIINNPSTMVLEKAIETYKADFNTLLKKYPSLDSLQIAKATAEKDATITSYKAFVSGKIALLEKLPKGSKSPSFVDYENHKGGKTSLDDLKGKYVYIDVWATWCGPCIAEIPALKEVEKKYHDKNIEFVSISVDDGRGYKADTKEQSAALAVDAWRKMVTDKSLGGIQLLSDKAWQSQFIRDYEIRGIPRFLLIDPDGKIVSADAPRPSSKALIELFDSLSI